MKVEFDGGQFHVSWYGTSEGESHADFGIASAPHRRVTSAATGSEERCHTALR